MFKAFLIFLFGLCCVTPAVSDEMIYVRIGTGSAEGTYFPVGGYIANLISYPPNLTEHCPPEHTDCKAPGLVAIAQSSLGSIDNLQALNKGEIEMAFVQSDLAYYAYHGEGPFKNNPIRELRAVANLYQETIHIVVSAQSNIYKISQLKGKRVALGDKKSGSFFSAKAILEAHNLSLNNVKTLYLSPGESFDELVKGKVDAVIMTAGTPVLTIERLHKQFPVRLLSLEMNVVDKLQKQYPFLHFSVIPEYIYDMPNKTKVMTINALWVTTTKMPEDLVYKMNKRLWTHIPQKRFVDLHPKLKDINRDRALLNLSIPAHEGTNQYFANEF